MNMKNSIKNLFKNRSIKILTWLALVPLAFLYENVLPEFFPSLSSQAYLEIEVLQASDLLAANQSDQKIKVLYNNEEIKAKDYTISNVMIKIKNTGGKDILKEDFDPEQPLQIQFPESKVLSVSYQLSNGGRQKNEGLIFNQGSDRITLKPFYLKENSEIRLNTFFIKKKYSPFNTKILGILKNIKGPLILEVYNSKERSIAHSIFDKSSLGIYALRLIAYGIIAYLAFYFVIMLTLVPVVTFFTTISSKLRENKIKSFKKAYFSQYEIDDLRFLKIYESRGIDYLKTLKEKIESPEALLECFSGFKKQERLKKIKNKSILVRKNIRWQHHDFNELISANLVFENCSVNFSSYKHLVKFIEYMSI